MLKFFFPEIRRKRDSDLKDWGYFTFNALVSAVGNIAPKHLARFLLASDRVGVFDGHFHSFVVYNIKIDSSFAKRIEYSHDKS